MDLGQINRSTCKKLITMEYKKSMEYKKNDKAFTMAIKQITCRSTSRENNHPSLGTKAVPVVGHPKQNKSTNIRLSGKKGWKLFIFLHSTPKEKVYPNRGMIIILHITSSQILSVSIKLFKPIIVRMFL